MRAEILGLFSDIQLPKACAIRQCLLIPLRLASYKYRGSRLVHFTTVALPSLFLSFTTLSTMGSGQPSLLKGTVEAVKACPREIFNFWLFFCTAVWSFCGVAKGFDEGLYCLHQMTTLWGADNLCRQHRLRSCHEELQATIWS
jgi:hypothetical protein